ncbi:diacylglycerol kinase family protein [Rhizosaccharibacter radicis]|uniref:Acylglycerol kinase family protein n=1 Tax=Rhizosaccharibacter radicis TaxID=2782605 RepID=A0ABT1VV11_9PROT|nr:acylglycerol kinase family protein [Acetobacteraceae bacterium KSS12]
MADGSGHVPALAVGQRLVGMISNPRSHRHGRSVPSSTLVLRHPELLLFEPRDKPALDEALRTCALLGIRLLLVRGGDGTLRDVLSALPWAYGTHPPEIALIPSGNTNLAARALGLRPRGRDAVDDVLRAVQAGDGAFRRVECPVMEVRWNGDNPRRPIRGFLLGAAAFTAGKKLADDAVHRRGIHNGLAVALAVAIAIGTSLFRRSGIAAGNEMDIRADGHPALSGRHYLLLVTSLPRMMLGLWPFWGDGDAPLQSLAISAPPRRVWRLIPRVLMRRGSAQLTRQGLHSVRSHGIELRLDAPFVLDGELYEPGPDGVSVSCCGRIGFVTPA